METKRKKIEKQMEERLTQDENMRIGYRSPSVDLVDPNEQQPSQKFQRTASTVQKKRE